MSTLAALLAQIEAADGYYSLIQEREHIRSSTLKEIHYMLYYRVAGYLRSDFFKVLVSNPGTADESAEFMNALPVILQSAPVDSEWKAAVLAKKAELMAGDSTIKRIIIQNFSEEEKFAIAVVYKLTSGKIAPSAYFLYDVSGVLTYYIYNGTF